MKTTNKEKSLLKILKQEDAIVDRLNIIDRCIDDRKRYMSISKEKQDKAISNSKSKDEQSFIRMCYEQDINRHQEYIDVYNSEREDILKELRSVRQELLSYIDELKEL